VGANLVVIDIPVGLHTKVPTVQDGRKLAREFIELGERLNMRVECALTYGDIPVGYSIGPKLEVMEALRVLEGATEPNSFIQKSLSIAGILPPNSLLFTLMEVGVLIVALVWYYFNCRKYLKRDCCWQCCLYSSPGEASRPISILLLSSGSHSLPYTPLLSKSVIFYTITP
jgi:hypothetical protein